MLIKNVSPKVLDVFFDVGFTNWARVAIIKNKEGVRDLTQSHGIILPIEIMKYLKRRLGIVNGN